MSSPLRPRISSFLKVIMADIPYFINLAVKKQGRGKKGISISKLPEFLLSHFYVLPEPKRIMLLLHDNVTSNTYVIEFMEEHMKVSQPSTNSSEGSHIGSFRYKDIHDMPMIGDIDLEAIKEAWLSAESNVPNT